MYGSGPYESLKHIFINCSRIFSFDGFCLNSCWVLFMHSKSLKQNIRLQKEVAWFACIRTRVESCTSNLFFVNFFNASYSVIDGIYVLCGD